MTRRTVGLVLLAFVLLAGGAAAAVMLSTSGDGDGHAKTAPAARGDAGVEYVEDPPGGRICEALPSFGDDRLRLRRFMRAVRRVTDAPRVTVAWLIDADTAADEDELVRSLDTAGYDIDAARFDGGAYGVTATRRTTIDLPALMREKDTVRRASRPHSDRATLMVAYPAAACDDLGPSG